MEKDAAVAMFSRSIDYRALKYTTYVGDGDSSSFGMVTKSMRETFGDDYVVIKEDCVGHIQKRMGTNLRNYKRSYQRQKLPDGNAVGGRGRLTDAVIDNFQNYYGAAIRSNCGNVKSMQNAIWAILYHSILGKQESMKLQHRFCPIGSGSWCQYKRNVADGTDKYNQAKCLPAVFRVELKPLFTRLSSVELLQRCLKCLTQNQNENINSILWSKCSKRVFCGRQKLLAGTAQTVMCWNSGAASSGNILKAMGLKSFGINTALGYHAENNKIIYSVATEVC